MNKDFVYSSSLTSADSVSGSPYPLAIVGISCYLPDAATPEEYWQNLFNDRVSIKPACSSRFPEVFYAPDPKHEKKAQKGCSYTNLAALIDFDRFCNEEIPRLRAEFVSHRVGKDLLPKAPGHLLALKVALEALRSTGSDPFHLPTSAIGVFCGLVSANRPEEFAPIHPNADALADVLKDLPSFQALPDKCRTTVLNAFLANKTSSCALGRDEFLSSERPHQLVRSIQEALGRCGTGFAFESACSSSVLALEIARRYLQEGALDAALVGGITFFSFSNLISFTNASSCSSKGSYPFDVRADGLLPGEGCVFAVVKSLAKAVADGDRIFAVVRGVGFSSDGRGKSLWAPSAEGQTLALDRAFQDARYRSWSEFDKIEAHATSTQLGDATELMAFSKSMAKTSVPNEVKIPITSVKANIGHLLEAAGAASVLKTVLELSHEQTLKQTSFTKPSQKFDWNNSHIRVAVENEPWIRRAGHVRKACVQAFGIGGLNAQVVLEGPEGVVDAPCRSKDTLPGRVAVVGVGCVLPGAFDVSTFKNRLEKRESAIIPLPNDRAYTLFTVADQTDRNSLFNRARGGFIQGYNYDWKRHRIQPNQVKYANPLQFMVLDAVDQAVLSAGYRSHLQKVERQDDPALCLKALDSHSTAVIVGTRSDSDFYTAYCLGLQTPLYQARIEKAFESEGVSSEIVSSICEDFFSSVYDEKYPCLKDETGGYTISTLASRITKTYDLMGGGFTLDAGDVSSFAALKTAALFLKRRADLRTVVCVLGHSSMNKNELKKCAELGVTPGEGAVAFLLKRVEDARQDDDSILAVISNIEEERLARNDANNALRRLKEFVNAEPTPGKVERPLFIETLCGADRAFERQFNAEIRMGVATNEFEVFGETQPSARDIIGDLRPASGAVAILNAILEMQDRDDNPRAVVSQWDRDGMVAQITLEKEPIETKRVLLGSNSMNTIQKSARSHQNDRVVFLFPGQGSQYPRMLASLLRSVPEARDVRDELDAELKSFGLPTFNELAIKNAAALGVDVAATQISLLVADTIVDRTLRRLGIEPGMVAGHSYGEYPALVAAGALTFADALLATRERCRIIDETVGKSGVSSGMLSTNASKDVIQKIFDRLRSRFGSDAYFVSNHNAPDNTIISAARPALAQIVEELRAERCGSVTLSVPAGYHSPLVSGVCAPLAQALDRFEFDFPKTPFLSGVSMRFESDPEVIRENLVEQMTKPVDFVEMIERAYRNGGRRFVEIGPKQVLTRLAAKILKDKPDARYYVCDYGPKGIDRDFDASIVDTLRTPRIVVPSATISAPKHKSAESVSKDKTLQASFAILHSDSLPEDVVSYSGDSYEIGLARGRYDGDRIRRALRRYADVAGSSNEKLLPAFDASELSRAQDVFGQSGYDELRGIAEGAGVPLAALIRHNLSVFPVSREFIPEWGGVMKPGGGCSHFAGVTLDGEFVHGGNIDAPMTNVLSNAIAPRIVVRCPLNGYVSVSVSLTGLIGSRGGVNERGLAATTSDLLDDVYKNASKDGLRRGVAIQTILDRCATVDEAIEFLKTTKLSGAKAIGLSDATGATAIVEYAGDDCNSHIVKRWFETNHATTLQSALDSSASPAHSIARYERLRDLLGSDPDRLELNSADAFSVLRDEYDLKRVGSNATSRFRTLNMICRADNAFSWLFYRNAGVIRFQRTYSNLTTIGNEDSSELFSLCELMPEYRPQVAPRDAAATIREEEEKEDAETNDAPYNPFMAPQDYLAEIDSDYKVLQDAKTTTIRYEDRVVPLPPRKKGLAVPNGNVMLVAATENALVRKLKTEIASLGGYSKLIALHERNGVEKTRETLSKEIAALCEKEFPKNVVILTSYDAAPSVFDSKDSWMQTRSQGIAFPMFALCSWYKKALEHKIDLTTLTVVAATRMGGAFGTDGLTTRPEDGAMTGLMRSLQYESFSSKHARVFSFCVDHEYDADFSIVAHDIIAELQHSPTFAEDVGYRLGKRYVLRQIACPQVSRPQKDSTKEKPVWIVTGGRRGVTAELALALGKTRRAKLCLIGSSDPAISNIEEALNLDENGLKELKKTLARRALEEKKKPAEEWARFERALETRKNLIRFKNAGIEVESYNCDLSNFEEAFALTRRLLEKHGRIDGVFFGAGYEKSALIEKTSEETALKVVDIKVGSAVAILSAFNDDNFPKTIFGMGSISGRLGSLGQVGYCVANNLLAKTLAFFARKRPGCRSTVIHWPAWGGVGMAMRPETKFVLDSIGVTYMPLNEGMKVFLDELDGTRRPVEICQTDPDYIHLLATNQFLYFSDEGLASIRESAASLHEISAPPAANKDCKSAPSPDCPTRALISLADYRRGNSCDEILGVAPELADPLDRLGRFAPRLLETQRPPDASSSSAWKGLYDNEFVLVLGDNELARSLTDALNRLDVPADNIVPCSADVCEEQCEAVMTRVLSARSERLATIVDLCGWTRNEPRFTESSLNATSHGYILFETLFLKPVVEALRSIGGFARYNHLVATRFGGDFGLSALENYPEGGHACGIAKGLRDEIHTRDSVYLPVKVVDHSVDAPIDRVVAHLLAELNQERRAIASGANLIPNLIASERERKATPGEWSPFDVETGYMGERRYVVRTIGLPLLSNSTNSEWFEALKESESRDGVWLLVGGLRGITNANLFALANEIRPKKIWLVVSKPIESVDEKYLDATEKELGALKREMTRESLRMKASPTKRWNEFHRNLECSRNLKAFKDLGIEIECRACNTRFTDQIGSLVQEIEDVGDRITFFAYGAGRAEHINAVELTNRQQTIDCVLTKTNGLIFFWKLLAGHPLKVVVVFGSVAGRFGGNGQISYSGHNDMCAKAIHAWRRCRPDCRFMCVEWGPWGDVGMAARPDIKGAIASAKILFLTKETGVPLFVREFHAGLPEPEVLFVSWKYYDRFQPEVTSNPKNALQTTNNLRIERKSTFVVDGETWEARVLRGEANVTSLKDASIYFITQPREYGAVKARADVRLAARRKKMDDVFRRVVEWRNARRYAEDDCLVILGIADAEKMYGRDEGTEYFNKASELEDSGDYGRFRVSYLFSEPFDVPTLEFIADSLAIPLAEGEEKEYVVNSTLQSHPLVRRVSKDATKIVATLSPEPTSAPYLIEHQFKRTPILPFVIALEAFAETITDETNSRKLWTFDSVKAVNGLRFTQLRPYRLRSTANRNESGSWNLRLVGERLNAKGETISDSFPYFTGRASYSNTLISSNFVVSEVPKDLTGAVEWVPEYPPINSEKFYHGPALQKLRRCYFISERETVGELVAPELSELLGEESACAILDSALLDASFWCCGGLNGYARPGKSVIPDALESLIGTSGQIEPGEKCLVHSVVRERRTLPMGYTQVVFDFVIYNSKGLPVWRANGFRMTEF